MVMSDMPVPKDSGMWFKCSPPAVILLPPQALQRKGSIASLPLRTKSALWCSKRRWSMRPLTDFLELWELASEQKGQCLNDWRHGFSLVSDVLSQFKLEILGVYEASCQLRVKWVIKSWSGLESSKKWPCLSILTCDLPIFPDTLGSFPLFLLFNVESRSVINSAFWLRLYKRQKM